MKQLSTKKTMTSREIAKLIGKRHEHVFNDIKKLNLAYDRLGGEIGGYPKIRETPYIHPQNKQEYRQFHLTKEQSFALLTGYDPKLRAAVIKEWQKKECEHKIPQTYGEALLEAGRLAIENEKLTSENAEMKPKAEFYDAVTDSRDTIDMSTAAKLLNKMGRNKLFEFLRNIGVFMYNNQPYQKYVDKGYFRVIEQGYEKPNGLTGINTKTLIYQAGLDFIRRKLKSN